MLNTEITEDFPLSSKISDICDIDVPPLELLNTEVTEDIPLLSILLLAILRQVTTRNEVQIQLLTYVK